MVMLDKDAILLSEEVEKALKETFSDLCKNNERFYYCALTISGDGGSPSFSAWSIESLEREKVEDRHHLKWSYSDSPYCLYKYDEYWKSVEDMWWKIPFVHSLTEDKYFEEIAVRIEILIRAVKNLDNSGLFSLNQKREDIFINIEFASPDNTNIERAYLLNPSDSATLKEYLIDNFVICSECGENLQHKIKGSCQGQYCENCDRFGIVTSYFPPIYSDKNIYNVYIKHENYNNVEKLPIVSKISNKNYIQIRKTTPHDLEVFQGKAIEVLRILKLLQISNIDYYTVPDFPQEHFDTKDEYV
jgi:hypothetical protein